MVEINSNQSMESTDTQLAEPSDFLDELRSYEMKNRRLLTAMEIQKIEMEYNEFVMNYFVYHQQSNTVAEYESSFLQLKRWAETWNEEKFDEDWVANRFVVGLKEEIGKRVKLESPNSLQRAIVLAKWQELCLVDKVFDNSPEPTEAKANSEIRKESAYCEETERESIMKVNSISSHISVSVFACFSSSSIIKECGYQVFDEMPKWDKNFWKSMLREYGLYWGERGKLESNEFSFHQLLTLDLSYYVHWVVIVDYDFFYLGVGKIFTEKVHIVHTGDKSYNEPKLRVAKASDAFVELADACDYALAVMPSAKGLVPEHHPHFIGTYWGAVSTVFYVEIVDSADAYLFAGPIFNDYSVIGYSLLLNKEKAIILQPDRVMFGNGPTFQCILMKDFLKALAKRLKCNTTAYENYHRIYVLDEKEKSLRTHNDFIHATNAVDSHFYFGIDIVELSLDLESNSSILVNMMQLKKLFDPQDDPLMMSQVENSDGLTEWNFGTIRKAFMKWIASMLVAFKKSIIFDPGGLISLSVDRNCRSTFKCHLEDKVIDKGWENDSESKERIIDMEANDGANGTYLKHEAVIVIGTNAPKSTLQESTNYTQPVEALALTEQSTSNTKQTGEALIKGWKYFLTYGRSVCVIHGSILTWTLTVGGIVYHSAELQLGFCFDPGGINLRKGKMNLQRLINNGRLCLQSPEKHSDFNQVRRLLKLMIVTRWGIKIVLRKDGLIHLLIEHLTIYLAMLHAYGKETTDAYKVATLNNIIHVFLALSCQKLPNILVMSMEGHEPDGDIIFVNKLGTILINISTGQEGAKYVNELMREGRPLIYNPVL